MITNLLNKQNINFTGSARILKSFHLNPEELDKLRKEKAAREILFEQGPLCTCYLIGAIKSTILSLNEYANKTGNQFYNARNWVRKLVVFDKSGNAEICFPPIIKNNQNKVKVLNDSQDINILSKGNKRVKFLEKAYGFLSKERDQGVSKSHNISEALDGGWSFLAIRDITGLKSIKLTQFSGATKQKELFKKYTGKLFEKFKEHPENLIITLDAKKMLPDFRYDYYHTFSLKKIVDDGLIIVDPKKNEEIKVSFDNFYKYFTSVNFARMRTEKMFKMLENAKKTAFKVLDLHVFDEGITTNPIRDKNTYFLKNDVYFNIKDKLNSTI